MYTRLSYTEYGYATCLTAPDGAWKLSDMQLATDFETLHVTCACTDVAKKTNPRSAAAMLLQVFFSCAHPATHLFMVLVQPYSLPRVLASTRKIVFLLPPFSTPRCNAEPSFHAFLLSTAVVRGVLRKAATTVGLQAGGCTHIIYLRCAVSIRSLCTLNQRIKSIINRVFQTPDQQVGIVYSRWTCMRVADVARRRGVVGHCVISSVQRCTEPC